MSATITQILNLTINSGVSTNEAVRQQNAAISTIEKTPGIQSISWGFQVEDPKKTTIIITYDSPTTLQTLVTSPTYPTFISTLQSYSTLGASFRVPFTPFRASDSSAPNIFTSSPLLFYHTIYLKSGTDKEAWMKALREKGEMCPPVGEQGFRGIVCGMVEGEEGVVMTAHGWDGKTDYEGIYRGLGKEVEEVVRNMGEGVELERGMNVMVDLKGGRMN